MRKKPRRKRPYFTMESAITAILRDASRKMHQRILFDRRLVHILRRGCKKDLILVSGFTISVEGNAEKTSGFVLRAL